MGKHAAQRARVIVFEQLRSSGIRRAHKKWPTHCAQKCNQNKQIKQASRLCRFGSETATSMHKTFQRSLYGNEDMRFRLHVWSHSGIPREFSFGSWDSLVGVCARTAAQTSHLHQRCFAQTHKYSNLQHWRHCCLIICLRITHCDAAKRRQHQARI